MSRFNPNISEGYPVLWRWLENHEARFAYIAFSDNGPTIHAYRIRATTVLVTLHRPIAGKRASWDIWIAPATNDVAETLSIAHTAIQIMNGEPVS